MEERFVWGVSGTCSRHEVSVGGKAQRIVNIESDIDDAHNFVLELIDPDVDPKIWVPGRRYTLQISEAEIQ